MRALKLACHWGSVLAPAMSQSRAQLTPLMMMYDVSPAMTPYLRQVAADRNRAAHGARPPAARRNLNGGLHDQWMQPRNPPGMVQVPGTESQVQKAQQGQAARTRRCRSAASPPASGRLGSPAGRHQHRPESLTVTFTGHVCLRDTAEAGLQLRRQSWQQTGAWRVCTLVACSKTREAAVLVAISAAGSMRCRPGRCGPRGSWQHSAPSVPPR